MYSNILTKCKLKIKVQKPELFLSIFLKVLLDDLQTHLELGCVLKLLRQAVIGSVTQLSPKLHKTCLFGTDLLKMVVASCTNMRVRFC